MKICIFLTNFNQKRVVDDMISLLKQNGTDIILIDNGSQSSQISQHTNVRLSQNIKHNEALSMGLYYSDGISKKYGYTYFAYVFIDLAVSKLPKDIINKLVNKLSDKIVGIQPSFTLNSISPHKELYTQNRNLREVTLLNGLYVFKSEWFNSVGRLDTDIFEKAKNDNKQLMVDDTIQIFISSDIPKDISQKDNIPRNDNIPKDISQKDNIPRKDISGDRFKILIYTDSRGEHVPKTFNHTIYGEKIAQDKRLDVTLVLCRMKWTTTLDFLEYIQEKEIYYDLIILHTGIVEHSPRKYRSCINDLYDNKNGSNSTKIRKINSKKYIFDRVFGENQMKDHLSNPMSDRYEGEYTNNMYSLDMAHSLINRLKKIPNLVWISSNSIVKGWNGNYFRQRPDNISIVEEYSRLFVKELPWTIDLNDWSDLEVKLYTCDNMHLTEMGSNYLYDKLMKIIETKLRFKDTLVVMGNGPSLKKVDLNHLRYFDTFGLNLAYRIYDKIPFYPKYFGCFDYKVTDYHREQYQDMIDSWSIKHFYFVKPYFHSDKNKVTYISLDRSKKKSTNFTNKNNIGNMWDMGNSGTNACHVGIALGYKRIILVGVDCSYVKLPESKLLQNNTLEIVETPIKNPNYWFDGYQQKGDIYNIPNADIFHQPAWEKLSVMGPKNGIKIINCSEGSTLNCFSKSDITSQLRYQSGIIIRSNEDRLYKTTFVFNIKLNPDNPNFMSNLEYTLKWYGNHYDKYEYEYIIVYQDTSYKLKLQQDIVDLLDPKIVFLYNPSYFNRGWGYNVAAKHYCVSDIVIFADSDIVLDIPENLERGINLIKNGYVLVSPYRGVYFTKKEEKDIVMAGNKLKNIKSKYPVTMSGGICLVDKNKFNKLSGYEEYRYYGGEDRSLDVKCLSFFKDKCSMLDGYGIHLYHPKNMKITGSEESKRVIEHLNQIYCCMFDRTLKSDDFIHKNCNHTDSDMIKQYIKRDYGDPNLYNIV